MEPGENIISLSIRTNTFGSQEEVQHLDEDDISFAALQWAVRRADKQMQETLNTYDPTSVDVEVTEAEDEIVDQGVVTAIKRCDESEAALDWWCGHAHRIGESDYDLDPSHFAHAQSVRGILTEYNDGVKDGSIPMLKAGEEDEDTKQHKATDERIESLTSHIETLDTLIKKHKGRQSPSQFYSPELFSKEKERVAATEYLRTLIPNDKMQESVHKWLDEYAEDLFTGTLLLSAESSPVGFDISRQEHGEAIRVLWQSVRKHSAELSPNRPASRSRSRSNSAHVDNSQATRNAETLINVLRPLVNLLSLAMEKKGEKDYLGLDAWERTQQI